MKPRILVIGLDGGAWDVLSPRVRAGHMPHLAELRAAGAWGALCSTVPPFTLPAWSSFMTGRNPGAHGIISFNPRRAGAYGPSAEISHGNMIPGPLLWERLAASGYRVGVVNVPLTAPPRPLPPGSCSISGMLTPPGAPFTWPHELAQQLPDYRIDVDALSDPAVWRGGRFIPASRELLRDIAHVSAQRASVCSQLIRRYKPDFFMVVFTGTDRLGHFFWPYLSPDRSRQGLDAEIVREVEAYLQALDRYIGALVEDFQPDGVVVMSDHGFGPAPRYWLHLNRWLEEQGFLHLRGGMRGWSVRVRRQGWLRRLGKLRPPQQRAAVNAGTNSVADLVDWPRTRAFAWPLYTYTGGIAINRRGLHPEGIVGDDEYAPLREQLIDALRTWREPSTGAPLARRIWRREELYYGAYLERLPDLIVEFDPAYSVVESLAGSGLIMEAQPLRSGDHRAEGVYLVSGAVFAPRGHSRDRDLIDLAPTLLHLVGLPVPRHMDGDVWRDLLAAAIARKEVRRSDEEEADEMVERSYSDTEQEAMRQQLKGLGYL